MLAALWARIGGQWSALGRVRPHHSVLVADDYLPANFAGHTAEFWATGEAEAGLVEAALARCGMTRLADKTCTEYGCGVGRVTVPLSRRFAEVYAYEISPPHLALAEQRAADGGRNIRFHLCSGGPPGDIAECDFFYSRLVFQHNPPPLIRRLIGCGLGALRPGGVAIFGVPTSLPGYRFSVADYLAAPRRAGSEMHCLPEAEIRALIAQLRCDVVEVHEERQPVAGGECVSHLFIVRRQQMTA
ncbi:MAG TPA: class I SAM-dependent methyltransferase [Stellaceae bacterium]|nr:class I SAM-dependent methyltransferase [Stellaceae bacterium]